jgi:protein ImuA
MILWNKKGTFMQSLARQPADSSDLLADILQLQPGRAHEFCGPARRTLAVWAMAQLPTDAPVIWLRPGWSTDYLHPQGLGEWASPEGLIILTPRREAEALGCAEEALRSGAVALVVVDLSAPPPLTPLRRLHLAAEAGLARRADKRLWALVLTPEQGGAPGVESRWHLAPCCASAMADRQIAPQIIPAWRLERLRARMAPKAAWAVTSDLQVRPSP